MDIIRRALIAVIASTIAGTSHAADCQAVLRSFLAADPAASSIYVAMVTLNEKNVASYTETRLYYVPGYRIRTRVVPGAFRWLARQSQGVDQPKFDFGSAVQVFSDRITNAPRSEPRGEVAIGRHGRQKFDESQADDLALELTDTSPVRVTITRRSWNDAKTVFTPTCEDGGFLFGSTPDEKYILRISTWGG